MTFQPMLSELNVFSDKFVFSRGVKLTSHFYLVPRLGMHGSIPPLLQHVFMAWCSVKKHRDNFTFTTMD